MTMTTTDAHCRVADLRARLVQLAEAGHRVPIGTDLVLHAQPDPQAVLLDGARLGAVMVQTARRYDTPLALSMMDLTLEKADLLSRLGVGDDQPHSFHFDTPPDDAMLDRAQATADAPFSPRHRAHIEALGHVAAHSELIPVGMAIGPFSLMTKLLAEPIMPVALAGMGMTADDEPDVALVERTMPLAASAVARSLRAQIDAGAQAVCLCEPAANTVFISPNQVQAGSDVFERFVMQPNLAVRDQLHQAGVGLIFHDCGELIDPFVEAFGRRIRPIMLSLGSSRDLAHDAALVDDDVTLFGNLPTKQFYSDTTMPVDLVEQLTADLVRRMRQTGHPFILGSECDVLSVTGSHETICAKVDRMMRCECR
jgi:uroporphyrinogen-III decarboxylase